MKSSQCRKGHPGTTSTSAFWSQLVVPVSDHRVFLNPLILARRTGLIEAIPRLRQVTLPWNTPSRTGWRVRSHFGSSRHSGSNNSLASFSGGLDAVVFIHLILAIVVAVGWELSSLTINQRFLATKEAKKAFGASGFLCWLDIHSFFEPWFLLLAGNCFPYHQSESATKRPRKLGAFWFLFSLLGLDFTYFCKIPLEIGI